MIGSLSEAAAAARLASAGKDHQRGSNGTQAQAASREVCAVKEVRRPFAPILDAYALLRAILAGTACTKRRLPAEAASCV